MLEDERISPDERERLDAYREKHRITGRAGSRRRSAAIGWTDAKFAEKLTEGEELEAYGHVLQAALAEQDDRGRGGRLAAYRKRHKVSRRDREGVRRRRADGGAVAKFVGATREALGEYEELLKEAMNDPQAPPRNSAQFCGAQFLCGARQRAILTVAPQSASQVSEALEERLREHRLAHGISHGEHDACLAAIGVTQERFDASRTSLLQARLDRVLAQNTAKAAEVEALVAAVEALKAEEARGEAEAAALVTAAQPEADGAAAEAAIEAGAPVEEWAEAVRDGGGGRDRGGGAADGGGGGGGGGGGAAPGARGEQLADGGISRRASRPGAAAGRHARGARRARSRAV